MSIGKYLCGSLLCAGFLFSETVGIMGGDGPTPAGTQVVFVNSDGTTTPIDLFGMFPIGSPSISSVSMNLSGYSLIGGTNINPNPTLYKVDPTGNLTYIFTEPLGIIHTVAITNSGSGVCGGHANVMAMQYTLAYRIDASNNPTAITPVNGILNGEIWSVDINDSDIGILGGYDGAGNLLAYTFDGSSSQNLTLSPTGIGQIFSVAINESGNGLIGGTLAGNGAVVYKISAPNSATHILSAGSPNSQLRSVAINESGYGIAGGQDGLTMMPSILYVISPTNSPTQVNLPARLGVGTSNSVSTVSINNSGLAIVGEEDTNNFTEPRLYFVTTNGNFTQIPISQTMGGMTSVAINDRGIALAAGADGGFVPFAYLITADGTTVPLNVSGFSQINDVDMKPFLALLTQIPTDGLHGNNLIYANYINTYAPELAFYFLPSVFDGTLPGALESAAPTRNAFSLFIADNNAFSITQSISKHIQDYRHMKRYGRSLQTVLSENRHDDSSPFFASLTAQNEAEEKTSLPVQVLLGKEAKPYCIWLDAIGSLAHQKAQEESPAFSPSTGALIAAFEVGVKESGQVGIGAAYAYTHTHENQGQGKIQINQEFLFLHGLYYSDSFYMDMSVIGGAFQSQNIRDISMTGFHFESKSKPHGWQLDPHLELGGDIKTFKDWFIVEPFAMCDWINNWQNKYRESGSGPFNVEQNSQYSSFLRSEGGVRFYETISFENWRLVLKEKGSYVNKQPFRIGRVDAFIVGSPGSFTVETLTQMQNLGVAEMEFLFEPFEERYPFGSLSYQGEFGTKYQSHQVTAQLSWSF
ncbi:MAG: autotransporter domain-containing protein [Parachlamydiales bacterium]|nr:autotransporter domain-containing protein [Parachlamydiales bacterium]